MANKIGFFGTPCYDLIHYVARTLYQTGEAGDILLVDVSRNQSLTCSIPYPEGYELDKEIDYRGITFAPFLKKDMFLDYETVLIYFGLEEPAISVDYAFLITDCELHNIADVQGVMPNIRFAKNLHQVGEEQDVFAPGICNLLTMGYGAGEREKFVAAQLGIDLANAFAVDYDDATMECRLFCQYDIEFKFTRISDVYKELIEKIVKTILDGKITRKEYKQAAKLAEKGK